MKKSFEVAGHVFSVILPDDDPLWGRMSNYAPFAVADSPDEIFSMELVEPFPVEGKVSVYTGAAEDPDAPRIDLYKLGENWLFELAPVQEMRIIARVLVSPDYTRGRFCVASQAAHIADFALNNALMLIYAFRTASLGTLEMHSSVIVHEGKGYMFLGKSGTGKSTHSSLWLKYIPGSRLLNDDNPIVRVFPSGEGKSPAPALTHDSSLMPPGALPSPEGPRIMVYGSPWSGKTPCYHADSAPVGAIVRLRQHPENIIRRMSVAESYASVYSSSSGFKAEKSIADGLHESVAAAVTSVPCFLLDCLPDEAAAQLCCSTVKAAEVK